jgi:uncharacterized protein YoxC
MPRIVDIALIVIALSLLFLIFLLIGLLIQIRRLVLATKAFLEKAQADLTPLVSNLTTTSAHLKGVSAQAGEGLSRLSNLFGAVGEGAETIRMLNSLIRSLLPSSVIGAVSFVVGVKAGLAALMNQLVRRRK